ncbi:methionyl aminopeptidase [Chlamydiales bacterium]|nr:methionyl aminopeptidase [Chlamydiales bacterium]
MHRNAFCWCGSGKKWKNCHFPDEGNSLFAQNKRKYWNNYEIILKEPAEIEGIKKANIFAASVIDAAAKMAKVGVTTKELDTLAREMSKEAGALCASLGYGEPPFPAALCTSLNEVICHGIPDDRPLEEGDILNIDFGCILNGYFGDCSRMKAIGEISKEKQLVIDTSYDSLMESIAILKPGVLISDIGSVIEKISHERGCSVVDQFVGHGVGIHYHENPQVPHCKNRVNIPITPGMVFTIEPMINAGRKEGVVDKSDHWTARTIDKKPSAQWEHSILITESGHEILTPWER